jgi:hypothetical protein
MKPCTSLVVSLSVIVVKVIPLFSNAPQLGITTDVALEFLGEHGLIMAHVGLPFSHALQIQSALKQKLQAERHEPFNKRTPLQVSLLLACCIISNVQDCSSTSEYQPATVPSLLISVN